MREDCVTMLVSAFTLYELYRDYSKLQRSPVRTQFDVDVYQLAIRRKLDGNLRAVEVHHNRR